VEAQKEQAAYAEVMAKSAEVTALESELKRQKTQRAGVVATDAQAKQTVDDAKQMVKDAEAAQAEEQKRFDERMGVLQRKTAEAKGGMAEAEARALRVANVLSMSGMAIEENKTALRLKNKDLRLKSQTFKALLGGGAAGGGAAGGAAGGGGGDGGGAGQGNDDDDDDNGVWVD
jgi:hypothetical protein